MTDAEQREAARQFVNKWRGKGNEDEDGRSYWIDLLQNVLGMEKVTDRVDFEKKVYVDGNKKRIDVYIPETRVIIEQKSLGIALDQKIHNSGDVDLTPYEQAKRYNDNLSFSEKARWIITSNFAQIWIYDMDQANSKDFAPVKIELTDLQSKYPLLDFLIKKEVKEISHEMEISIQAGDIVGKLYDALIKQYKDSTNEHSLKSLNALCVRLVFCLYAEDAGIFGRRNMFHDYLVNYDAEHTRSALIDLFQVLDQKEEERDLYLREDLAEFPYVNGGLFSDESIEIPRITEEIRDIILKDASEGFDWSDISPTIFGAVFESTLNPETRRSGGMHYTSIENIHKVIDPLFLDDLKAELDSLEKINVNNTRTKKLHQFQDKLASLTFLDPACGSGNFLTETYLSLRRLENRVIKDLTGGQMVFGEAINPIKVSITQFFGIEINDFAVTVAKTALWIAESQMMKETEEIIVQQLDFLPLTTNANIVEANALRIDWNEVVPAEKLDYIMGNPPFVGTKMMNRSQKADVEFLFSSWKNHGLLDYVACWYKKAAEFIRNTAINCAFVSTNSITQGEQVAALWKTLLQKYGIHINFAYREFVWDSEAQIKAQVHVVIIGFSLIQSERIILFDQREIKEAKNINGYLMDAPYCFVERKNKPICKVPQMYLGCSFYDGNNLVLTPDEKDEILYKEPQAKQFIHPYMMGADFIARKPRYCIWLLHADPSKISKCPEILKRVRATREFRKNCKKGMTQKAADTPTIPPILNYYTNDHNTAYLALPRISSQKRRYIPAEILSANVIAGDSLFLLPDVNLFYFGVITSNVHMAWMRTVCGRLKSDYRYSSNIVYNNFPWPYPTADQKTKIEHTAQGILDARALYPDSSLADLYDPLTMPPELRKAHKANDIAVMKAYGFSTNMSEADCVAELMNMYMELTADK